MSVSLENLFMANKSIQNTQTGGQSQPVNSAVNQLLQDMFSTGDVISGKVSSMQGNVVESFRYKISQSFGKITAAETTGPARGPHPTSSTPQIY